MSYKIVPLKYSVSYGDDNPIFGEHSIHIEIDDEAAGPFLVLTSNEERADQGRMRFDMKELEVVTDVARKMILDYETAMNPFDPMMEPSVQTGHASWCNTLRNPPTACNCQYGARAVKTYAGGVPNYVSQGPMV